MRYRGLMFASLPAAAIAFAAGCGGSADKEKDPPVPTAPSIQKKLDSPDVKEQIEGAREAKQKFGVQKEGGEK